jgi:NAD(P)H-flavin reductase
MLFFGARDPGDLFYVDELKEMEKRLPDFTYVPVLSRAAPEDGWEGEQGRVTDLIEKMIPDGATVDVHLCGAPPMIKSCIALLEKKGIPANNIAYDKFE